MRSLYRIVICCIFVLVCLPAGAEYSRRLKLPNLEQLPSARVLCIVQDSEGFLWYATDGGGVCVDDGRQTTVFRNDAEHPDLLGSNNVVCLAAAGNHIVIGTTHGASILDKQDYSIRRLAEVDDKRVDDALVDHGGHWWLTSNKKVFEYSAEGEWLHTYQAGDKYIFRLHADRQGHIWASEWDGGLLQLREDRFVPAPWPLDIAPTNIEDNPSGKGLLISTFGRGVVHYDPQTGQVDQQLPSDSVCMSRVRRDLRGQQLVADGLTGCYVLADEHSRPWYSGQPPGAFASDSLRANRGLSERPAAFTFDADGQLWFSTGHDIRRQRQPHAQEKILLPQTTDVSAMAFASDGTLWLGTIYGIVMTYKDGTLTTDDYASNEYGDALLALQTDSLQRLLLVGERYVRLYDPARHTLRQQSHEAEGTYAIELAETRPGQRWSRPAGNDVVERLPHWLTAWWMVCAYILLAALLAALLIHYYILRKQRRRFLQQIKQSTAPAGENETDIEDRESPRQTTRQLWLETAIAHVRDHIDDADYSVEQLSSELAMSRMTFYRKIQAATGQKPTEFIRTVRLRRAAELLREGQLSVTEISYATGFTSVSYFSRCFRTMYGVPPTQYLSDLGHTTTAEPLKPSSTPS